MIRTYTELIKLPSFEERFRYLKLSGKVGKETFGYDRYLNQALYHTDEWDRIRDFCIVRDYGCDLAIRDREIHGLIIVHHMNPITKEEILSHSDTIFDPEFLITTTINTHNAIHYGDEDLLVIAPVERRPNDTTPWR